MYIISAHIYVEFDKFHSPLIESTKKSLEKYNVSNENDTKYGSTKPIKSAKVVNLSFPNLVNTEKASNNLSNMVDACDDVNDNSNPKKRDPWYEPIHIKFVSNWSEINDTVDTLTVDTV